MDSSVSYELVTSNAAFIVQAAMSGDFGTPRTLGCIFLGLRWECVGEMCKNTTYEITSEISKIQFVESQELQYKNG